MMQSFNGDITYRVDGDYITKENFIVKIFNTLQEYHFAEVAFLAMVLKAHPSEVHEVLLDGIILYLKEEPETEMKSLCSELYVKSKYILELYESGRIDIKENEMNDISLEFFEAERKAEHDNKRRYAIKGFLNPPEVIPKKELTKRKVEYHFIGKDRDKKNW